MQNHYYPQLCEKAFFQDKPKETRKDINVRDIQMQGWKSCLPILIRGTFSNISHKPVRVSVSILSNLICTKRGNTSKTSALDFI
jgi:hypothetical protein